MIGSVNGIGARPVVVQSISIPGLCCRYRSSNTSPTVVPSDIAVISFLP